MAMKSFDMIENVVFIASFGNNCKLISQNQTQIQELERTENTLPLIKHAFKAYIYTKFPYGY